MALNNPQRLIFHKSQPSNLFSGQYRLNSKKPKLTMLECPKSRHQSENIEYLIDLHVVK